MFKYFYSGPKLTQSGYEFKMKHSFEKRKGESDMVIEKYDKIPIIIEVDKRSSPKLPVLKKTKFGLDKNITVGQLLMYLRKEIKVDSSQAIFLLVDYVNGIKIPNNIEKIGDIYTKYADKDGFLYMTYSANQTFG